MRIFLDGPDECATLLVLSNGHKPFFCLKNCFFFVLVDIRSCFGDSFVLLVGQLSVSGESISHYFCSNQRQLNSWEFNDILQKVH